MNQDYIPGEGCECSARCSCECGCDVDWTPREVHELREQRDRLAEALRKINVARLDDFMGPHDMALNCVSIARETLASVKGGNHDN